MYVPNTGAPRHKHKTNANGHKGFCGGSAGKEGGNQQYYNNSRKLNGQIIQTENQYTNTSL